MYRSPDEYPNTTTADCAVAFIKKHIDVFDYVLDEMKKQKQEAERNEIYHCGLFDLVRPM